MKQKIIVLVLISFVGLFKAQTLIYNPSKTYTANIVTSSATIAPISFKNNTTTACNLIYKNYSFNFPSGWAASVCDSYNCLGGISWGNWNLDSLKPGEEYYIQLSVNPNHIEGNGYLEVHMWRQNAAWLIDTLRWFINAKTVGIQEISSNSQIQIFPVPVKDVLNIKSLGVITSLSIVDAVGRSVMQFNDVKQQINISSLEPGYYTLFLEKDGIRFYRKILKD